MLYFVVPRIHIIIWQSLTFLGIIALQNKPLSHLIGYPIECHIVSLEYFAAFKKALSEKEVLIIRGLPSDMSEAKIKVSLKRRLGYEGHIIKDCIINGTEAHITFENNKCKNNMITFFIFTSITSFTSCQTISFKST